VDFERMMMMEGVTPINKKPATPSSKPAETPVAAAKTEVVPGAEEGSIPIHAWVSGKKARQVLDVALERHNKERFSGDRSLQNESWIRGIRDNGAPVVLDGMGAPAILAKADRERLKVIVISGQGWSFMMHPLMGIATMEEDPGSG
jgi:hypothetical protein